MLRHKEIRLYLQMENKRPGSDEILYSLDFTDFNAYVDCIKGKQANKRRFNANKTLDMLELIHTDIYGLLLMIA